MYLCALSTAASTGAPARDAGMAARSPNCARSTPSGIVFTSSAVAASYTVIVCRYIMFCANTRPVSVAVTDFGEMLPLIVVTCVSVKSSAGLCGVGGRGRRRSSWSRSWSTPWTTLSTVASHARDVSHVRALDESWRATRTTPAEDERDHERDRRRAIRVRFTATSMAGDRGIDAPPRRRDAATALAGPERPRQRFPGVAERGVQ